MENLSLQDAPPPGGPQGQQMPPPIPQLPPQMFTTAAQLLDLTDKKLLVSLRDGRKLIGVLRSWDQFANLVLQDTVERIFAQNLYADIQRGVFLVRGENVLLLGEIDLDKDDYIPEPYREAPVEQVFALQRKESAERKRKDKVRQGKLAKMGTSTPAPVQTGETSPININGVGGECDDLQSIHSSLSEYDSEDIEVPDSVDLATSPADSQPKAQRKVQPQDSTATKHSDRVAERAGQDAGPATPDLPQSTSIVLPAGLIEAFRLPGLLMFQSTDLPPLSSNDPWEDPLLKHDRLAARARIQENNLSVLKTFRSQNAKSPRSAAGAARHRSPERYKFATEHERLRAEALGLTSPTAAIDTAMRDHASAAGSIQLIFLPPVGSQPRTVPRPSPLTPAPIEAVTAVSRLTRDIGVPSASVAPVVEKSNDSTTTALAQTLEHHTMVQAQPPTETVSQAVAHTNPPSKLLGLPEPTALSVLPSKFGTPSNVFGPITVPELPGRWLFASALDRQNALKQDHASAVEAIVSRERGQPGDFSVINVVWTPSRRNKEAKVPNYSVTVEAVAASREHLQLCGPTAHPSQPEPADVILYNIDLLHGEVLLWLHETMDMSLEEIAGELKSNGIFLNNSTLPHRKTIAIQQRQQRQQLGARLQPVYLSPYPQITAPSAPGLPSRQALASQKRKAASPPANPPPAKTPRPSVPAAVAPASTSSSVESLVYLADEALREPAARTVPTVVRRGRA
ncbi:hypothetical protein B0A49_04420 [Cryomyces minteri]|uniref:U6 snRNA-associated Sm-like protein LSm1 n=1 Tax=Cryomyces minteri TaxID=331657 RepID=A0A4U0XA63_9PEZI|nr:hypothetical protein B0A49_04420 [Cryomyces minteri]